MSDWNKASGKTTTEELRRESAAAKAERIVAEKLARLGWTELDLERRRKNDPAKLAIAARLRRETILPLKSIAARVRLGSSKSANAKLKIWMQQGENKALTQEQSNTSELTIGKED